MSSKQTVFWPSMYIMTILSFFSLISLEDAVKDHPFYIEATKLAVKVCMSLW